MGNTELNNNINFMVVFNGRMEIITADECFFTMCGSNSVVSMTRCIYSDDIDRFNGDIFGLDDGEETFTALRFVTENGNYKWMLCTIRNDVSHSVHGRLYKLSACDAVSVYNDNTDLRVLNERNTEYLSLVECLMLHYSMEEDKLMVFLMSSNRQNLVMYSGPLGGWKDNLLSIGCIDMEEGQAIDALCQTIADGETFFAKEVKLKLFHGDCDYKDCLVKGKTIVELSGNKAVIAVINILSDNINGKHTEQITLVSDMKDAGTDLLNKRAISDYTRNLIQLKPNHNITIAVLDIDDFKTVNDTYGHMFGDEVLNKVAKILMDAVGKNGLCGRIGGDEMFIVMQGLEDNEAIRGVLRTIRNNVSWLYHDDERQINKITCSIGSATWPTDAEDYDTLFNIADKMLYLAKEKGKNRYIIYHKDLHGEYVNGIGKAANLNDKVFYKYRKIEIVNLFIRQYAKGDEVKRNDLLEKICLAFEIDSICLYMDSGRKKVDIYGQRLYSDRDGKFFEKNNYLSNFRGDGLCLIDNTLFFEDRVPALFEAFSDMGISQAVQYIVGGNSKENNPNVISFNRIKLMKKWAEMDAAYLAILGDLIGLVYLDEYEKN